MNLDGGVHDIPVVGLTGRMWLCGKHVIGPDVEALLARTVASHVVCLVQRHELVDRYDDYVRWLDRATREGRATWFPVHDLSAPAHEPFVPLVQNVHRRLASGENVVVHCAAGKGRAGTLAVAVCLRAGMTVADALAHVRRHRPGAGPEVGEQSDLVGRLERDFAVGSHDPVETGERRDRQ